MLVLLPDRILGVDFGDVVQALLDCLIRVSGCAADGGKTWDTFLSLSFSCFSSLEAFAAWRLRDLAVNWSGYQYGSCLSYVGRISAGYL